MLWAGLTGRSFYKYQAHAGSEYADLTMDVEQNEQGTFQKRVKELYRHLREGKVVIDLDEANVAPWVLWVLEPILRGERWVHPIFPEEEPFRIGEGVQVILTFNPERYAGRHKLDQRLLERMIVAWMGLPDPRETARIVESFYGVWEEPGVRLEAPPAPRRPKRRPSGRFLPGKGYPPGPARTGSCAGALIPLTLRNRPLTGQEEDFRSVLYRVNPIPTSRGPAGAGGSGGGNNGDSRRIQEELQALRQDLAKDAEIHDELAGLFASGKGDTEFIFDRMLRSLRDRIRILKKRMRRGLEIDPVAFMLKKAKQFVRRQKDHRLQSTAVAVLLDFSGSMEDVKEQLAYTIGATGENFWKLSEAAPQHFFYDLSWFTEAPTTVVAMGERLGPEENARRLVTMANRAGEGGTAILPALSAKLRDFLSSREGRSARVKYLILFTDGADEGAVQKRDGRCELTPEMAEVLEQYQQAGIDVIAIGIGEGAEQVRAFDGPGRHFVRVDSRRSGDIAEAIAKVAELKSRGALLPDGDLNAFLQIKAP